jgi:hypothetical protein
MNDLISIVVHIHKINGKKHVQGPFSLIYLYTFEEIYRKTMVVMLFAEYPSTHLLYFFDKNRSMKI